MEGDPLEQNWMETGDAALQPLLDAAQELSSSHGGGGSGASSSARALVLKVLGDADIFAGYDQIRAALEGPLGAAADKVTLLLTLDLFSYGVLRDYHRARDKYLDLNAAQLFKLRQLTVITTVQRACCDKVGYVAYQDLAEALDFKDAVGQEQRRSVEEVLLSCLYAGAISGKLCQKTGRLVIGQSKQEQQPPCRARDVSPEQVQAMIQQVERMQQQLQSSFDGLAKQRNAVKKGLELTEKLQRQANAKKKLAGNSSNASSSSTRGGSAAAASTAGWVDPTDAMDLAGGFMAAATSSSSSRRQKRSRGGSSAATVSAGDSLNFRTFQL